MLPNIQYLSWAIETFPHAKWDLATSGLQSISAEELGVPSGLSDVGATQLFASKVAERYGVPEAEVVPALGTSGAVWTIAASVLTASPASGAGPIEVVVEEPAYEPLLRVIEGFGATVRRVARLAAEGYRLDPARVGAALTERTKLVVVANPHNPTGAVTPDEDLAQVAAACAARGAYLLVGEVYRELVAPRTTARSLGPNVLAASSLTKCFGLGWARAGWALVPAEMRAAARAAEMHAFGTPPSMCGAFGAHALGRIDALEERARRLTEGRREIVDAFLARHPQLSWLPPPRRALFGFVRAAGIDVAAGLARAAAEHGVFAVPGAYFGEPGGFRLSWATLGGERLAGALDLLANALGLDGGAGAGARANA